ncbi:hypothetical protein M1M93_00400 [Thermodesulfovibrionales bacterium]|nr:hypothetical protein [Thermodesulfovibrionales bacterium]
MPNEFVLIKAYPAKIYEDSGVIYLEEHLFAFLLSGVAFLKKKGDRYLLNAWNAFVKYRRF